MRFYQVPTLRDEIALEVAFRRRLQQFDPGRRKAMRFLQQIRSVQPVVRKVKPVRRVGLVRELTPHKPLIRCR